jgi:hypothetical protein
MCQRREAGVGVRERPAELALSATGESAYRTRQVEAPIRDFKPERRIHRRDAEDAEEDAEKMRCKLVSQRFLRVLCDSAVKGS